MIRCVKIGPHITPTPAYVAIFEAEMVSSLPLTTSDMDARMALKYTVSAALRNIACTRRGRCCGGVLRAETKREAQRVCVGGNARLGA